MIDKESYVLPESNYYKTEYKKNQIVIGHTGRKGMRHFEGWLNRRNGKYKGTSSFTIERDGQIHQHFDPKYYSDFIGNEQDKSNISISLENVGWFKLDGINNVYIDWLGHIYSKDIDVKEVYWRGHSYWAKYTEKQMESLSELINQLCEQFDIQKEVVNSCVFNEDVDLHNGITFKSNYKQEITGVSPAFNMDLLKETI